MKLTTAITLCLATISVANGAHAGTLTDAIEQQLRAQGFNKVSVSTTMLGRTRIDAISPTQTREIVVNPRTGEILRDYWADTKGTTAAPTEKIVNSKDASKEINTDDGASNTSGDGTSSSGAAGTSGSGSHGENESR